MSPCNPQALVSSIFSPFTLPSSPTNLPQGGCARSKVQIHTLIHHKGWDCYWYTSFLSVSEIWHASFWNYWESRICCNSPGWLYKSSGRSHLHCSRGVGMSQLPLLNHDAASLLIPSPVFYLFLVLRLQHFHILQSSARKQCLPPCLLIALHKSTSYTQYNEPESFLPWKAISSLQSKHTGWMSYCTLITWPFTAVSPGLPLKQPSSLNHLWNPDLFSCMCSSFPISQKEDGMRYNSCRIKCIDVSYFSLFHWLMQTQPIDAHTGMSAAGISKCLQPWKTLKMWRGLKNWYLMHWSLEPSQWGIVRYRIC